MNNTEYKNRQIQTGEKRQNRIGVDSERLFAVLVKQYKSLLDAFGCRARIRANFETACLWCVIQGCRGGAPARKPRRDLIFIFAPAGAGCPGTPGGVIDPDAGRAIIMRRRGLRALFSSCSSSPRSLNRRDGLEVNVCDHFIDCELIKVCELLFTVLVEQYISLLVVFGW